MPIVNLTAFTRVPFTDKNGFLTREAAAALFIVQERTGGTTGTLQASSIVNTPAGGISAINVQAAIDELETEKAAAQALEDHTGDTDNPHEVTKAQVGLDQVDNTADADKPVSTATQAALDDKANSADLGTLATQDANAVSITGGTVRLTSGSLGYANGNGGTVAQTIGKGAGVTLDEICGEITMDAEALAAGAAISFVLTNSKIAAADLLVLNHVGGGILGDYAAGGACAAGSATVSLRNLTAGSLSDAVVLRFAVIKGATA